MLGSWRAWFVGAVVALCAQALCADTFTFQGRLVDGGQPAVGPLNLAFRLYDAESGGTQIGSEQTLAGFSVFGPGGEFTVNLDFGAGAFPGPARWLEVWINGAPLSPRQPITAAPYALHALSIAVENLPAEGNWALNGPLTVDDSTLHIDPASNRVGIGTTSPSHRLHVETPGGFGILAVCTATSGAGNDGIWGITKSAGGTGVIGSAEATTGQSFGVIGFTWSPSGGAGVMGQALNSSGTNYGVRGHTNSPDGYAGYFTGGRNYFQGNVGIGTASPNKKLTVAGDVEIGTGAGDYRHLRIGGGNASGFLYGSFPHFGDGIHIGYNYYADGAGVNHFANGGGGSSRISMGYGFTSMATAPAFGGEPIDRLIVTESGRVGVGTWAPIAGLESIIHGPSTATGAALRGHNSATSGVYFGVYGVCDSASGYDFFAGGACINYGNPSSIRWKRNIEPIASPLEKLSLMRGVYFDWNEDHGGQRDIGMIAEEVGAVLPEVVAYEENGIDASGMDYGKLTPLLVEAIKALHAETDAQNRTLHAAHAQAQRENGQLRELIGEQQAQIDALLQRLEAVESAALSSLSIRN